MEETLLKMSFVNRSFVKNVFPYKNPGNRFKPDSLWKTIKEFFPYTLLKYKASAKTFKIGEIPVNDKKTINEEYCEFFFSNASKLKGQSLPLTNFAWKFGKLRVNTAPRFRFQSVVVQNALKQLRKLKRKCAAGVDNLPTCYRKDTVYVIAEPLAFIMNLSLKTGMFSNDLKMARITPTYKSGAKDSFDNYHPISILPALSKIFKRCVHKQLMDHLEYNHLLSDRQFGFRRNRSTEQAIAFFTDQIRTKMDKGRLTGAVFIDMSLTPSPMHPLSITSLHMAFQELNING